MLDSWGWNLTLTSASANRTSSIYVTRNTAVELMVWTPTPPPIEWEALVASDRQNHHVNGPGRMLPHPVGFVRWKLSRTIRGPTTSTGRTQPSRGAVCVARTGTHLSHA